MSDAASSEVLSRLAGLPAEARSALLAELLRHEARDRLSGYVPYPKQREFHAAGAVHRERLLMAGNKCGKTYSAAAEVGIHLTGRYPAWWEGRRWDRPVVAWVAGITAETTKDTIQKLLVGPAAQRELWGTGMVPGACLGRTTPLPGTPDAVGVALVAHVSGGWSEVHFKSYGKGREAWQAADVDLVWLDEECGADVYTEALTRTNATKGMVMMTFTPMLGMSTVVRMFLSEVEQ